MIRLKVKIIVYQVRGQRRLSLCPSLRSAAVPRAAPCASHLISKAERGAQPSSLASRLLGLDSGVPGHRSDTFKYPSDENIQIFKFVVRDDISSEFQFSLYRTMRRLQLLGLAFMDLESSKKQAFGLLGWAGCFQPKLR